MKKKSFVLFLVAIFLTACNREDDKYVFFTSSEHVNEKIIKCLEDEEVKYKIGDEGELLVKEADNDKAILGCS